jgi:hypothetical protein
MNGRSSARGATDVSELLSLWDEEFVDAAYWSVLGRAPDESGRAEYLHQIRTGHSKYAILRGLRESSEGQEANIQVKGLDDAIRNYRQSARSLRRRILRAFLGSRKADTLERANRALENQEALGSAPRTPTHVTAVGPIELSTSDSASQTVDAQEMRNLRRRLVRIEASVTRMEAMLAKSVAKTVGAGRGN